MVPQLVDRLRTSREFLLRQLRGLPDETWEAKPEGAQRSVREIVEHMLANDQWCVNALEGRPQSEDVEVPRVGASSCAEELRDSNERLVAALERSWSERPAEALELLGGSGIARGVTYRVIEDYYHAGQVCWLRLSVEPAWDSDVATYAEW